jgi:hypothetical protein
MEQPGFGGPCRFYMIETPGVTPCRMDTRAFFDLYLMLKPERVQWKQN